MVCDQPCSTDQGDIKGRFEILRDNTPSSVVDSGLPDTNNVRQTQSLYHVVKEAFENAEYTDGNEQNLTNASAQEMQQ